MTDQELVELFWQRREEALTGLQDKYGGWCRSIAGRILGEERDVEDVTVEGECLAGADLSGLEFRRVRLHRCRFQNCDFSGAVFDRVEWSGCDFATRKWKGGVNGCIANATCVGCTSPNFPDGMSPFYEN